MAKKNEKGKPSEKKGHKYKDIHGVREIKEQDIDMQQIKLYCLSLKHMKVRNKIHCSLETISLRNTRVSILQLKTALTS